MISGFMQNGLKPESLGLFQKMQNYGSKPDSVTLASFLPALADNNLRQCMQIHAYVIINEIYMHAFLASALIDVYFECMIKKNTIAWKCSRLDLCQYIFDNIDKKYTIAWNSMTNKLLTKQ